MAALVLAAGATASAYAAGPEEVFRGGNTLVVRSDQTIPHDLFLAGETILIEGTVQGDVMAFGNTVTVNGTIEGDLWAAGNTVLSNGRVRGDLRVGANRLVVGGEVGRNVLAGVNSVVVGESGRVGGDLMAFAARMEVAGQVRGDISGRTEAYRRTGTIGGRELVQIRPRQERAEPREQASPAQWLLDRARHWLGVVLVGALLLLIWRGGMLNAMTTIARRPLASLGSGMLALVASIVALIIAFIIMVLLAILFGSLQLGGLTALIVIGTLLAEAVTVIVLVVLGAFVAGALIGLLIGRLLLQSWLRTGALDVWLWLLVGTILYVLLAGLPAIGPFVRAIAALLALGALGLGLWSALRGRRAAPARPEG
jgi:cytoskeletal protein CcmA (bactofilin family)